MEDHIFSVNLSKPKTEELREVLHGLFSIGVVKYEWLFELCKVISKELHRRRNADYCPTIKSTTTYGAINEFAWELSRLPYFEKMDASQIAYFLTALYLFWSEKRRGREDETAQMVNEAMEPLMQLRAITDAARTTVMFDKELKRHGFDRYDPSKKDKESQ